MKKLLDYVTFVHEVPENCPRAISMKKIGRPRRRRQRRYGTWNWTFTHREIEDGKTHQKCSAAILVADVGKSPDVSKADGETEGGEEELAMVSPLTLLVEHF